MAVDLYSFPSLLKHIRAKAGLNQEQFAKSLGVSKVSIAMFESGHREPTKKIIKKLANKLEVSEMSISPFLSNYEIKDIDSLSLIERKFYDWGGEFQRNVLDKRVDKYFKRQ